MSGASHLGLKGRYTRQKRNATRTTNTLSGRSQVIDRFRLYLCKGMSAISAILNAFLKFNVSLDENDMKWGVRGTSCHGIGIFRKKTTTNISHRDSYFNINYGCSQENNLSWHFLKFERHFVCFFGNIILSGRFFL